MFDLILKKTLSLTLSLATLFVPKDTWQKRLDEMPSPAERVATKDLKGWEYKNAVSPSTGEMHGWYYYPSTDTGSTKVLLLLHGFNTDGSIFFKLKPLASTHTLIAYNFPERSDFYTGSIRDFESILDDFCEVAKLDTVDLLGNSLGGIVATFYTARSKRIVVNNLILASTYVHGSTKANIRQIRGMADKLLPYPDYKLYYLLNLGNSLTSRLEKKKKSKDSPLGTVVIKHIDWYRQILKALYWYDGTIDAKRVTCPVLVLHGTRDRLIPQEEIEATKRHLPQAKINLYDKEGHTLIYSHAEQCIADMRKQGI
jgi:pimeloyl-ACP methyl ester carboxylesterase